MSLQEFFKKNHAPTSIYLPGMGKTGGGKKLGMVVLKKRRAGKVDPNVDRSRSKAI
jgi:hypothetical protein